MKTSKRVEMRDARKRSKKTSKTAQKLPCPLFLLAVVALMSSLAKHSSFGQMWSMREYAP